MSKHSSRRELFSDVLMFLSLGSAFTLFASYAIYYLFPHRRNKQTSQMFVAMSDEIKINDTVNFSSPSGETFILRNTGNPQQPFQAFSNRCPHLGCKVIWEKDANRFFCPCHAGAFDVNGKAIAGPPLAAGQSLKSCPIEQKGKSLYAILETE